MKTSVFFVLLSLAITAFGQSNINAFNPSESIVLNGHFYENVWNKAQWQSQFIQLRPILGNTPSKSTKVADIAK